MPLAEGGGVFVSYRRQESRDFAGRLADHLANHFGEGQVFIDVDTIEPGADFAIEISRAVAVCEVLLAVIGPTWLTATDERGVRRLDDPEDIVRLEIEAALARDVRVIPILVEGTVMPGRSDLPESLAGLARRRALLIRHESFHSDVGLLVTAIERVLAAAPGTGTAASGPDASGNEPARVKAELMSDPGSTLSDSFFGNEEEAAEDDSTSQLEKASPAKSVGAGGPGDNRSVFLVHGRDTRAAKEMRIFFRALNLRVIGWEKAVQETGQAAPYIGDVIFAGMRMADAVVVLLTPDDLVRLRPDLLSPDDPAHEREIRGQARANVIYEAGIADALDRSRTVLIEFGEVKSLSDLSGRSVLRFDGRPSSRHELVIRLRNAGLAPDTTGSGWLENGDFHAA
jgi:predicted nucleotide-binding protein